MQRIAFPIAAEHAGRRLDTILTALVPDLPHAEVRRWLRKGFVRKNGARTSAEERLAVGDTLQMPPWAQAPSDEAEAREDARLDARRRLCPPDIRWEDEDLLVAYKPAGLASHPGIGHDEDSLSARLSAHVAVAPGCKVGLAQRLDAGVSGLTVCGKHPVALKALMGPPHGPAIVKLYAAVVTGSPQPHEGDICEPLRVTDQPRGDAPKVVVDRVAGQSAHTRYVVVQPGARASLVLLRIFSGRTHQIRAHLRALGHPLIGDPRYGHAPANEQAWQTFGIGRPLLHASYLSLRHPVRHEEQVTVFSAPPSDMERMMGRPLEATLVDALQSGQLQSLLAD